ncbi:Rne/Rng family ribonuclease [Sphingomonas morindae]|nr:ribonuclease E/G [Sphingomonas morindae]
MLIDARHPEETRVAVLSGNRIEEFDFESAERRQLKGNIYLAKVTRVEPSLQAAFVEFGGNRHGFLAFSEIHPDYYQIPKEDREALLREEAEEALRVAEDDEDEIEDPGEDEDEDFAEDAATDEDGEGAPKPKPSSNHGEGDQVEALRRRRQALRRRYKIQDVIHRRQVLLVQVVKEERGNKGAALTTYLSLAGRYCVLMPNTSHGGGISRKISNAADRKRLKSIMAELKLPRTMGCIVRTAGLSRTKTEIKRDFDYLARLWDEIRENTLSSTAPALIYEDSNLIKRAIRDIYTRDIDEVLIEGESGYHAARDYMKLLMPAHARKVRPYSDAVPLFQRFGAEDQLSAMYNPVVQLKSGGYIVINPTEALVSIDINSGRSTREHNIEQTATATNLEAAHEIARQLRLRDMAGLVVIDFIDMENGSNIRKVEKAMKEALKNDRARIQVGRISSFGLLEMSRQRLRTGVLEASTRICPHCEGTGFVRTASSAGLSALRLLEETAARGRGSLLCLRASREAAIYVLNRKRAEIADIEDRYGVRIEVLLDGQDDGARMSIEVSGPPPAHAPKLPPPVVPEDDSDLPEEEDEDEEEEEAEAAASGAAEEGERGEGERNGRRKRRRRRRGGRRDQEDQGETLADGAEEEGEETAPATEADADLDAEDEAAGAEPVEAGESPAGEGREGGRRRRRGRRGGRRREAGEALIVDAGDVGPAATDPETPGDAAPAAEAEVDAAPEAAPVAPAAVAPEAPAKPKTRRRPRARAEAATAAAAEPVAEAPAAPEPVAVEAAPVVTEEAAPAPKRKRAPRKKAVEAEAAPVEAAPAATEEAAPAPKRKRAPRKKAVETEAAPVEAAPAEVEPAAPAPDAGEEPAPAAESAPRRGWWQRTFGA